MRIQTKAETFGVMCKLLAGWLGGWRVCPLDKQDRKVCEGCDMFGLGHAEHLAQEGDLARSLGQVEDMNPELERQAWQETWVKGSPAGIYCTLVMCQALC